jgi:hypothetical protein
MFGTLVICLPSPHEGGDVVVTHNGQTKVFVTSQIQPSALCWYSDVHHEVLPVKSGYRWVLTYNLAVSPNPDGPPRAGRVQNVDISPLRNALNAWLQYEAAIEEGNSHIYYLLDHEYTEASISLKALKGDDLARIESFSLLSEELEFDVLLAVLEKKEVREPEVDYYNLRDYYDDRPRKRRKYDDDDDSEDEDEDEDEDQDEDEDEYDDDDEVLERSYEIKKLVDVDGNKLRQDVNIGEDFKDILEDLIPEHEPDEDPFDDSEDVDEDYEGVLGNSVCYLVDMNSLGGVRLTLLF